MNTLLFDTSLPPEEQKKAKRKRAGSALLEPENQLPKKPLLFRANALIGRIDDTYQCADAACGAECHDILDDDRGQWLIECCFCGTQQAVPAIAGVVERPPADAFRFRDGRYAGMTIDEAAGTPRGADYLAWAAESHPRPAVREAVRTWLAKKSDGL